MKFEIFTQDEILEIKICQEFDQDTDHIFAYSKWITDHLVFTVFEHEPNPFTNQRFSYIPIYSCLYPEKTNFSKIVQNSKNSRIKTELGTFLGFRLWDEDLPKYTNLSISIYREATIVHNPNYTRHLNKSYRDWLKSKVFERKLVNKANKMTKTQFLNVFKTDKEDKKVISKMGKLWYYVNRTFRTVDQAIDMKKQIKEEYGLHIEAKEIFEEIRQKKQQGLEVYF